MEFLNRPFLGFPIWLWLIIGAGGLLLALFLRGRLGSSSSSSSGALGQNAAGQNPAIDSSVIDPYTGVPYSIEQAVNPATGLPAYYGGPGVDTSGGTSTSMAPGAFTGTIRAFNSANTTWDTTHPQGVPIRPTPGSNQVAGYFPYGSTQQVTGPAVTAQYNGQGNPLSWYPVQGGYIDSTDITASSGTGSGGQGGSSGPNAPWQATPWWPEMTDLASARNGGH